MRKKKSPKCTESFTMFYWKNSRFQANLCSLRSQCWQYETIQSDFEPLWSWQEKNGLFSALLLLVINRWCHKRKERLCEKPGKYFFSHEWFFLFLFQPQRRRTLEKNCYANFEAMPIVWQKGGRRIRWEKKVKVDFKSFWKLARTARNL